MQLYGWLWYSLHIKLCFCTWFKSTLGTLSLQYHRSSSWDPQPLGRRASVNCVLTSCELPTWPQRTWFKSQRLTSKWKSWTWSRKKRCITNEYFNSFVIHVFSWEIAQNFFPIIMCLLDYLHIPVHRFHVMIYIRKIHKISLFCTDLKIWFIHNIIYKSE